MIRAITGGEVKVQKTDIQQKKEKQKPICHENSLIHFSRQYIILFIHKFLTKRSGKDVTTTWRVTAEKVCDKGFVTKLMRASNGGVSLFNIELIENDSPGAGYSDKGVSSDFIWGEHYGRKILYLDDHCTMKP